MVPTRSHLLILASLLLIVGAAGHAFTKDRRPTREMMEGVRTCFNMVGIAPRQNERLPPQPTDAQQRALDACFKSNGLDSSMGLVAYLWNL